ncbi:MAG: hypothetical protein Kow0010_06050 [Dehalococcoidia bacterium]
MAALFDAVKRFFEEGGWDPGPVEGRPSALKMPYRGRSGAWTCVADVIDEADQVVFFSISPVHAPESRRGAVAEFLTRANYGIILGNFEMDYADGEVRYKTALDVEGDELSDALLRNIVLANLQAMDFYLPGLLAVIYGERLPAEVVAELESRSGG